MAFANEVKKFIEDNLQGSEANLEVTPGGRIVGRVLWQNFEEQEQIERQQQLWNLLRSHFKARASAIGVLLAYTPDELQVMQAA